MPTVSSTYFSIPEGDDGHGEEDEQHPRGRNEPSRRLPRFSDRLTRGSGAAQNPAAPAHLQGRTLLIQRHYLHLSISTGAEEKKKCVSQVSHLVVPQLSLVPRPPAAKFSRVFARLGPVRQEHGGLASLRTSPSPVEKSAKNPTKIRMIRAVPE